MKRLNYTFQVNIINFKQFLFVPEQGVPTSKNALTAWPSSILDEDLKPCRGSFLFFERIKILKNKSIIIMNFLVRENMFHLRNVYKIH